MDLSNPRGYEARMIATLLAHARLWLDIGDRAKALELINEAQATAILLAQPRHKARDTGHVIDLRGA